MTLKSEILEWIARWNKMVSTEITATLKDDTIRLSRKLYLFKNDGDVNFIIELQGIVYQFDNGDNYVASAVIRKPSGQLIKMGSLQMEGNKIHLRFDKMHIDEMSEVGEHLVQISLHSSTSKDDRLTLPIFSIYVQKPLE